MKYVLSCIFFAGLLSTVFSAFMAVFFHNSFIERAKQMNDLSLQIAKWEYEHETCLGKTIDDVVWIRGCNYRNGVTLNEWSKIK